MRFSTWSTPISPSISEITRSSRPLTEPISSSSCFSPSLIERCEAIVSASLLGSSIWFTETSTSGGTFLLSFTYCSNWLVTERPSASSSSASPSSSSIFSARASKNAGLS